ncbi:MAG: DNA replication/repair protein RecF [Bacteroidetes bacterium]|nr:DNA replication/repair protein RecF [Bacteroidota bacterium]MBU1719319.1 DNA replication/repair protein RecF [Bacteroidota bacterium]
MYLDRLNVLNYRNYQEAGLDLCPRLNCFIGDNAMGKTNLLDAIHYLSFCKSFSHPLDSQNIRHGEEMFIIKGIFIVDGKEEAVFCGVKRNQKKQFKLNNKEYQRLADHIGRFPLVIISPDDSELVKDGSDIRRRFMDTVISQFDNAYLNSLITYNQVLKQRNTLLKQFNEKRSFNAESLRIWDEQMIAPSQEIFEKRKKFIARIAPFFNEYYRTISGSRESVGLQYESHLHDSNISDLLAQSLGKDRVLEYTTKGVHKDELVFKVSDFPVKKFGSQGQQKSYIIALKLAEFEVIRQEKGFCPMLLLDDIFDKLDETRVMNLLSLVAGHDFGQIFITDTGSGRFSDIFKATGWEYSLFSINSGQIISTEKL